jgi:hypothetical protein
MTLKIIVKDVYAAKFILRFGRNSDNRTMKIPDRLTLTRQKDNLNQYSSLVAF